jgi:hypothetical protein
MTLDHIHGCTPPDRPATPNPVVFGAIKTRACAASDEVLEHTFGSKCPACPGRGGEPGTCDHSYYGRDFVKFVQAHLAEFVTAHRNPDKRTSRAILERLSREFETLPPRHSCSCPGRIDKSMPGCPSEDVSRGFPQCPECRKLHADDRWILVDVGAEVGRTYPVEPPMPDVLMLDAAAGNLRRRRRYA